MKLSIFLYPMLVAVPLACASDPNKKVQEAKAQEAQAMREQTIQSAEQTKETNINRIEDQTSLAERQAGALPPGSEQRAKAQAQMTAARATYQARAQERLQKIEARLEEARRKLEIAGARAPTSTHDKVNNAIRERTSVANDLNHLPQISNDAWDSETKRLDARLDALEAQVDEAKTKVDSAMP